MHGWVNRRSSTSFTQSEYESLMACSYDDLRHDEAFTAGFDRVTSVDITLEGTDYTITSEGDDDERTFYYGEEEVDLGDLRSALADALATEFTSEAPTQKEEIRLTLHLDSEAYPQTELVFYRYDGDSCLASGRRQLLGPGTPGSSGRSH